MKNIQDIMDSDSDSLDEEPVKVSKTQDVQPKIQAKTAFNFKSRCWYKLIWSNIENNSSFPAKLLFINYRRKEIIRKFMNRYKDSNSLKNNFVHSKTNKK